MATSVVFDEDAIVTFLRAKVKATHLILAKEEELVKQDEILDKACQAIDEKYSRYPEYRAYGDAWKKLGKAEKELCYVADVRHLSEDERFTDVDVNGPVSVKRIVGYLTDHKNIIRKQLEASTVASNQHLDEEKEEEEEMHRALTISRSWADDDIETDAVVFQDQKAKEEELKIKDEILDKVYRAVSREYRAYSDAWKKLGKAEKELCCIDDMRHLSEDGKFADVGVNGPVSAKRIVDYLMDRKNIIRNQREASTVASNQLLDEEEEMRHSLTISRSWADDEIETDRKGHLDGAKGTFDNLRQTVHDPRYGLTDLEKRLCLL
ncbi:UNVERIFIED_CONTAM: hypothetical protein FKN15_016161 [Acipenser sinensis]